MAKKQPTKTCSECIHECACRVWTDGRVISDATASQCPNHETVKESGAYLCGVLDERKRKQTNADRIRAMSDEELEPTILAFKLGYAPWCDHHCKNEGEYGCDTCILNWLKRPAEEGTPNG